MPERNLLVMDVVQGTANNALHHEMTDATRLVAVDDGILHCIRDGMDRDVHGRYIGIRHLSLPFVNSSEFPWSGLVPFFLALSGEASV